MKKPYSLRLDTDLMERLKKIAESENRSRSNLIEFVLWERVKKYNVRLANGVKC